MKKRVIRLTLDLLNCCKANNVWELNDLTSKPFSNLIEILSDHPEYKNIWDYEITIDIISFLLSRFPHKQQSSFTDNDAVEFINNIHTSLVKNTSKHWIVVPLRMAKLNNTIQLRNFVFITGNKDEKIEILCRLSQMSKREADYWAQHTENAKSPGFFEHPLLAIKVTHQTKYVEKVARLYALWTICSLQVIYWGYVYRDEVSRLYPIPVGMLKDCDHLAIWSKDRERCGHQSLNFRTICKFNLDWMSQRVHQKRFKSLFNCIVMAQNKNDKLTHRFFKALRLFGKAIDTENNSEAFEGMGITLVYLMTIAEGVLLDQDFEKRNKLTVLLPYLAKLPDIPLANVP